MSFLARLFGRAQSGVRNESSGRVIPEGAALARRDFLERYPRLCVVCTSVPTSAFRNADDKKWLLDNRDVLIGSFLGMEEPSEIRQLVKRWETDGFETQVMAGVAPTALVSDELAELARAGLHVYGLAPDDFRAVRMGMKDIYNKTDALVYCWFFRTVT